MDQILEIEITLIIWLQSIGAWLTPLMKFFSSLGNEEFYLLVAPAIYWCLSTQIGLRMGLFLMISASLNTCLKFLFHSPRPYWYDLRIQALSTESSFGIPSGHSQNAVVVWGILARYSHYSWAWIVAALLMFLIGLSRLHLGVHFLRDTILGWLIGMILFGIFIFTEPFMLTWLKKHNPKEKYILAVIASFLVLIIGLLANATAMRFPLPEVWINNAAAASPGADPIHPLTIDGLFSNVGAFLGLACGAIWLNQMNGFSIHGSVLQRVIRYLIGLVGVFLIWRGLGIFFPTGESVLALLLRFVRYSLIGLWISALAPLLFIRLRLAKPSQP
jgi:membrane-associated phospholipid phosphatase